MPTQFLKIIFNYKTSVSIKLIKKKQSDEHNGYSLSKDIGLYNVFSLKNYFALCIVNLIKNGSSIKRR